jgi:PleD family two-component response regulator
MGKGRILVVEDDTDISKMLRIYFDSQGYEVLVANKGGDALDICRTKLPNVVVLDINLPDIDGYDVCRNLRSNTRTSYVPIIFLTQRDERSDKIAGLELGADDYITKPFDIEELKLRVEGSIRRSMREALTHPVTNLPAGKLIEEQLKIVKEAFDPWTLLYFGIRNINAFKEVYGPIQVNEVLIFLADIMRETIEAYGTLNDFIGQASDNDFIIITTPKTAPVICKTITQRFNQECSVFYSFPDRERGNITYKDIDGVTQTIDFMKMAVGVVSSEDGPFADIVQITEDAAENRRRNTGCPGMLKFEKVD